MWTSNWNKLLVFSFFFFVRCEFNRVEIFPSLWLFSFLWENFKIGIGKRNFERECTVEVIEINYWFFLFVRWLFFLSFSSFFFFARCEFNRAEVFPSLWLFILERIWKEKFWKRMYSRSNWNKLLFSFFSFSPFFFFARCEFNRAEIFPSLFYLLFILVRIWKENVQIIEINYK